MGWVPGVSLSCLQVPGIGARGGCNPDLPTGHSLSTRSLPQHLFCVARCLRGLELTGALPPVPDLDDSPQSHQ